MSTPATAYTSRSNWTSVSQSATAPTGSSSGTLVTMTVKPMTSDELEHVTKHLANLNLAQEQIANARARQIEARAEQAEARAEVAAGRALATEGRAQTSAATATMVAQLEKFKDSVRMLHRHVKAGDTQSPAKIDSLIQKITSFQENLPNNADARKKIYDDLRAEAKAIQLGL